MALAAMLLTSLYFVRERAFEPFLIAHQLLALTAIGGTIWHVEGIIWPVGGTIWHIFTGEFMKLLFPIISLLVWSMTTAYRVVRNSRNRGTISDSPPTNPSGTVLDKLCIFEHPSAMKFDIRIPRYLNAGPGAYVYLRFSCLPWRYRYQAHPFMIVWCTHDVEERDGRQHDVTDLTFLVQPRKGLTARLYRELELQANNPWRTFHNLASFDGPYGQDLHLERYDIVVLVAKGIGIAGVLPHARYLAYRQRHDHDIKERLKLASTANKADLRNSAYRDATRKVDLLWVLEFNRQEEWISDELRNLQDLDPHRVRQPPSADPANLHSVPI